MSFDGENLGQTASEAQNQHPASPEKPDLKASTEIHDHFLDHQKDNVEFIKSLDKISVQEKQKLLEKAAAWEKSGALDQLRAAGLTLDQLKQNPLDRHIQLAAMFLKRETSTSTLSFRCNFNGNDFAETQTNLADLLPPNILEINIVDKDGKIIFEKAKLGFKDGKPGYFTADGKQAFVREGFLIQIKGTQSSAAINDPRLGRQTYEHALKEQVYLTENSQKTQLKNKIEAEAQKKGRTLIPTPEFYDKSLTKITRSPKLEEIFHNGQFDFSKLLEVILAMVTDFSAKLTPETQSVTSETEAKQSKNQAEPLKKAKPASEDRRPKPENLAPPISTENPSDLPKNPRDQAIVQDARALLGSKNFRGPEVAGGNLACAQVVSTALMKAGVIDHVILNVDGVQSELLRKGWQKHFPPAQAGDIVVWGKTPSTIVDGIAKPGHGHIGIMTGKEYAVNNNSALHTPVENKVPFNSPRGIYLLSPPDRNA